MALASSTAGNFCCVLSEDLQIGMLSIFAGLTERTWCTCASSSELARTAWSKSVSTTIHLAVTPGSAYGPNWIESGGSEARSKNSRNAPGTVQAESGLYLVWGEYTGPTAQAFIYNFWSRAAPPPYFSFSVQIMTSEEVQPRRVGVMCAGSLVPSALAALLRRNRARLAELIVLHHPFLVRHLRPPHSANHSARPFPLERADGARIPPPPNTPRDQSALGHGSRVNTWSEYSCAAAAASVLSTYMHPLRFSARIRGARERRVRAARRRIGRAGCLRTWFRRRRCLRCMSLIAIATRSS